MRYIIAEKSSSSAFGFDIGTHRTNGNNIILNEKEVMNSTALKGETIEEKLKQINGTLYERNELIQTINEGGWNE